MRIWVFETEDWEHAACQALERSHDFSCTAEPLGVEAAGRYADAEVIAAFIRSDLSAETLRRLPRLKLICTRSTGYDHIDLDYCRKAGVTVCNVPDYGDPTVAEHAFALLLAVTRRIVEAADRTRRGDFEMTGLRGIDLAGRTLGVIGAGRIGRRAIAIARGFAMTVVATDARPDAETAAALGFRYAPLETLLETSDVITLHVPGGPSTHAMISDAEFARMKPGAILINTARGGVVDAEALVRALVGGRLAGAGLDVLAEEPLLREEAEIFRRPEVDPGRLRALLANNALTRLPNVVVTPHIAYDTREALGRIVQTTVANIEAFVCGRPQNVVAGPQETATAA